MNRQSYLQYCLTTYVVMPGDGTRYRFGIVFLADIEESESFVSEATDQLINGNALQKTLVEIPGEQIPPISGIGRGSDWVLLIDFMREPYQTLLIRMHDVLNLTKEVVTRYADLYDIDRYTVAAFMLAVHVVFVYGCAFDPMCEAMLHAPEFVEKDDKV